MCSVIPAWSRDLDPLQGEARVPIKASGCDVVAGYPSPLSAFNSNVVGSSDGLADKICSSASHTFLFLF